MFELIVDWGCNAHVRQSHTASSRFDLYMCTACSKKASHDVSVIAALKY